MRLFFSEGTATRPHTPCLPFIATAAVAAVMALADGFYQHGSSALVGDAKDWMLYENNATTGHTRAECTTAAFYNSSDAHSVNFCSLRQFSKEQVETLTVTATVCGALSMAGAAFIIATFAVFKQLRVPSLQLIM